MSNIVCYNYMIFIQNLFNIQTNSNVKLLEIYKIIMLNASSNNIYGIP